MRQDYFLMSGLKPKCGQTSNHGNHAIGEFVLVDHLVDNSASTKGLEVAIAKVTQQKELGVTREPEDWVFVTVKLVRL